MTRCPYKLVPTPYNTTTMSKYMGSHTTHTWRMKSRSATPAWQVICRSVESMVYGVTSLVQATVTVRLDYCNSTYNNLPMMSIHRLQITQNSAARLISRTPRHEHITPVLVQLHWLPITKRCQFNILTMTYKASHHIAPPCNLPRTIRTFMCPNLPLRSYCG